MNEQNESQPKPQRVDVEPKHAFDKVVASAGPGDWVHVSFWVHPKPGSTLRDAVHALADTFPDDTT